ncbi:hypothetical protein JY471_05630 [Stenotrophomonas maltophilia]|uniref:transketolase family protein n=1 Tax=Stenotrophomonas maltophilia TaxID=40324 RepID=UPI000810692F|nr:transketolase [Stenotrophomonas maltophilia]MBN5142006.1 hypothetical protein [Stenotrophomonas maltophilia]OCK49153.1 transketolase [Stenotrophomonas maltophilia]PJL09588.1 transketolase [Stenotrophomonas maltophilia]PJL43475.1 transketolase [Stenotrophomonas maltophilia]BBO50192.1 hypothetical protein KMM349_05230 [Stenotrophomonas maltophilia]
MRKAFATAVIAHCATPQHFFLTGDLGFMALEEVKDVFGSRFINAGVAEQNMIGVAAGLAREGNIVFAYSIAPFCYARPFEQIRNDVCLPGLPVCLVGNGGGFAYGHMGPTHHALEDCAAMMALGMDVKVPAFDEDLPALLQDLRRPTYLRLGYDARPAGHQAPPYAAWRQLLHGERGVLAALGPMAGVAWSALAELSVADRPAVWAVTEPDVRQLPKTVVDQLRGGPLYVVEEHVREGGLGMSLAAAVLTAGHAVGPFIHRHALRYPSGRFGSQQFHRRECGLDAESLHAMVKEQTA